MTENPLVSICMITYNHELYIAQAIESILMQKTDFQIEVLIGEDCSTDKTRNIVAEFVTKHPNIIKPFFYEKNIGMIANFVNVIEAAKGKYIAILEGDDLWSDELKLQKQVTFLENNNGYIGSFHNMDVMLETKNATFKPINYKKTKNTYTFSDFLAKNHAYTASLMYRNKVAFDHYPQIFHSLSLGDWPLHFLNLSHGNYYFHNEIMGKYRVHATANWSSASLEKVHKNIYNMYIALENYFPSPISKKFNYLKHQILYLLLKSYVLTFDVAKFKTQIIKMKNEKLLKSFMKFVFNKFNIFRINHKIYSVFKNEN